MFTHIEYNEFCFVFLFYFVAVFRGGGGGGSNCSFCFRFNSDIYKVGVRNLNDCCLFCGLLCCSYVCWKINVKQIGHGCCDMICYSNTVLQLDGKLHQIWFSTCMICHSDLIVTWHDRSCGYVHSVHDLPPLYQHHNNLSAIVCCINTDETMCLYMCVFAHVCLTLAPCACDYEHTVLGLLTLNKTKRANTTK